MHMYNEAMCNEAHVILHFDWLIGYFFNLIIFYIMIGYFFNYIIFFLYYVVGQKKNNNIQPKR